MRHLPYAASSRFRLVDTVAVTPWPRWATGSLALASGQEPPPPPPPQPVDDPDAPPPLGEPPGPIPVPPPAGPPPMQVMAL